jgi:hypothetical protein
VTRLRLQGKHFSGLQSILLELVDQRERVPIRGKARLAVIDTVALFNLSQEFENLLEVLLQLLVSDALSESFA